MNGWILGRHGMSECPYVSLLKVSYLEVTLSIASVMRNDSLIFKSNDCSDIRPQETKIRKILCVKAKCFNGKKILVVTCQ
jgi:hypothetical protein